MRDTDFKVLFKRRFRILSGGTGELLWPLSTKMHYKQYIPIVKQNDGSINLYYKSKEMT